MPAAASGGLASKSNSDTSHLYASDKRQLSKVSAPSEVPQSSDLGSGGQLQSLSLFLLLLSYTHFIMLLKQTDWGFGVDIHTLLNTL